MVIIEETVLSHLKLSLVLRRRLLKVIIRAGAYVCAKRDGKSFTKNRGKQLQSLKLRMEYGKRNGIFTRTKRNFLRFRYEKPTAPQRKTYGSNGGNI